jgi:hypothetical protein
LVEVKPAGVINVTEPEIEAGVSAKAGATPKAAATKLTKPRVEKRIVKSPKVLVESLNYEIILNWMGKYLETAEINLNR